MIVIVILRNGKKSIEWVFPVFHLPLSIQKGLWLLLVDCLFSMIPVARWFLLGFFIGNQEEKRRGEEVGNLALEKESGAWRVRIVDARIKNC